MELNKEALEAMVASAAQGMTPERAAEFSGKIYAVGLAAAADLYRRKRFAEAVEVYAQLIEMRPGRMEALIGLGQCMLDLEDPFRAFEVAGNITAIDPENASGWLIAGKAQYMLGSIDTALDDFITAEDCARESGQSDLLKEITRFRAVAETKLAAAGARNA